MDSNCSAEQTCGLDPILCDSTIDHLIEFEPYDTKSFNLFEEIIDISSMDSVLKPEPIVNSFMTKDTHKMKSTSISMCNQFDYRRSHFMPQSKLDNICHQIIQKMNCLGMCVIDNFLEDIAGHIREEVLSLYASADFNYGMLLNGNTIRNNIRGDLIYWITGTEPNCNHIHELIRIFDLIVFKCNKMNNNGVFGVYNITSRTPAMVACYPGQGLADCSDGGFCSPIGSCFMKHADNYSGDGRCITCIYYVNKDWQYLRDGGVLRVYPNQMKINCPFIDVEPIYDRLIIFWSDRRNLHEVLPSNALRFAITVWYFDDEERKRYKQMSLNHF